MNAAKQRNADAERLQQGHLAAGVAAEAVVDLLAAASPRTLQEGGVLCKAGDPANVLWFLVEGTLDVVRESREGTEHRVGTIVAPSVLGHLGLVDNARRSATCRTRGGCRVYALDRTTFSQLVRGTSRHGAALRRLLLVSLTRQISDANERVRELIEAPNLPPDGSGGLDAHILGV